jgi:Protein of unknown function (DUF4054)
VTATITTFRDHYPEFFDVGQYPDSLVTFYLQWGYDMLNNVPAQDPNFVGIPGALRWGKMLDRYVELWCAHCITLEQQAKATADAGGVPGISTGAISGQTVGPIGVTYNASVGVEENAGWFGLTIYGNRLFAMILMAGSGGLVI